MKRNMEKLRTRLYDSLKKHSKRLIASRFSRLFIKPYELLMLAQYHLLCAGLLLRRNAFPSAEEAASVAEQVTFIYKSFERQKKAERLFRCIQRYYPGARVIIADDSEKPLTISDSHAEVIHMPFNSGLSRGLNCALERVTTPFTMRMDDDELLTPKSKIHEQLAFLKAHPEVDLAAIQAVRFPILQSARRTAEDYRQYDMREAPEKLLIPHMTKIDQTHYVMGKVPNIFLARTEPYRSIGYDDHIRMIDHHEFFYRAAGHLVSAMDISAYVFHYHNEFDQHYGQYRSDWKNDAKYIYMKQMLEKAKRLEHKEFTP